MTQRSPYHNLGNDCNVRGLLTLALLRPISWICMVTLYIGHDQPTGPSYQMYMVLYNMHKSKKCMSAYIENIENVWFFGNMAIARCHKFKMVNHSCKTKAKRSISSKLVFAREYSIQRQELQDFQRRVWTKQICKNFIQYVLQDFYEIQNENMGIRQSNNHCPRELYRTLWHRAEP